MQADKQTIKTWLKRIKKNRAWLAEQCDVSKRTVDDWLSTTRELPAKAILSIQSLMNDDALNGQTATKNNSVKQPAAYPTRDRMKIVNMQFTDEEWADIEEYQKIHPEVDIAALAEQFVLNMARMIEGKPIIPMEIDIPTTFIGTGTHLPDPQKEVGRDQWKEFVPDKPSPQ